MAKRSGTQLLKKYNNALYPSGILLVVFLGLSIAFFLISSESVSRQVREAFHLTVSFEADAINKSVRAHSAALKRTGPIIHAFLARGMIGDISEAMQTESFSREFPGFVAIDYLDAQGKLTIRAYPEASNLDTLAALEGADLSWQDVQDAIPAARASNGPVAVGKIRGSGDFFLLCAIKSKRQVAGYTLTQFSLARMIRELFQERAVYSLDPMTSGSTGYFEVVTIEIAGTKKHLYFPMPEDFEGSAAKSMPYLILLGGGIISVLLFLVFRSLTSARNRALELAEKMTEDLRKATTAAVAANQAKSEFLASMSHEIRNPINVIIGMSEILAGMSLAEQQKKYLDTLQNAGEHLLGLINDILDLSRIESGQLELETIPFDLAGAFDQAFELYKFRAMEKKIGFVQEIDPALPKNVLGDPVRLKQILVNLLGNAFKFTREGQITISAKLISLDDGLATIEASVRDTGIGIPASKQAAIFDKFTQVDASTTRRFGGTGLGLAICKRLTELMGGRIHVESEEGQGSRFIFTTSFKLAPGEPGQSQPQGTRAAVSNEAPADKLRILLAEDSPDNRSVLSVFLRDLPHELAVAENGAEALDQFKQQRFDLVLMDNQMPVMDGLTAVREIRSWERANGRKPTTILALTADSMKSDIENSLAAGCDGHLTKPVRKAVLLEAVRKHTNVTSPGTGHP
ncbi:MAG: response regulator [Leptospirales bacterium]|nr:response regulator [Leptospirales bacterium]